MRTSKLIGIFIFAPVLSIAGVALFFWPTIYVYSLYHQPLEPKEAHAQQDSIPDVWIGAAMGDTIPGYTYLRLHTGMVFKMPDPILGEPVSGGHHSDVGGDNSFDFLRSLRDSPAVAFVAGFFAAVLFNNGRLKDRRKHAVR